jgi:hypothetical protein
MVVLVVTVRSGRSLKRPLKSTSLNQNPQRVKMYDTEFCGNRARSLALKHTGMMKLTDKPIFQIIFFETCLKLSEVILCAYIIFFFQLSTMQIMFVCVLHAVIVSVICYLFIE